MHGARSVVRVAAGKTDALICPEDCFNTAVESLDPHIYLTGDS